MNAQHTALPWAVEKMPSGRITITSGQFFVAGNDCSHGMHEEDAAHIVRCVNSHEALVEKLRANHRAVDWLMAKLILLDPTFLPSKSPIWPDVKGTADLLSQVDQ